MKYGYIGLYWHVRSGIPSSSIVGYRSPFLNTNPESLTTLQANNFLYDCSIPLAEDSSYVTNGVSGCHIYVYWLVIITILLYYVVETLCIFVKLSFTSVLFYNSQVLTIWFGRTHWITASRQFASLVCRYLWHFPNMETMVVYWISSLLVFHSCLRCKCPLSWSMVCSYVWFFWQYQRRVGFHGPGHDTRVCRLIICSVRVGSKHAFVV